MQAIMRVCPFCGLEKHIGDFVYIRGNSENYRNCRACDKKLWESTDNRSRNDPREELLDRSLRSALERGIEHRITAIDIPLPIFCSYLAERLIYRTLDDKKTRHDFLATVDRIDSRRGYLPNNIQVISFLANCMKYKATEDQLIIFARNILKLHASKNNLTK